MEISSCARVDAKPIDSDKQITYNIAKYREGPLKKIPASAAIPPETIQAPRLNYYHSFLLNQHLDYHIPSGKCKDYARGNFLHQENALCL